MPRRRLAQLAIRENLPEVPRGARKKAYYPAGNLVYYLQSPDDVEWKTGEISEQTTSTSLHVVIDEVTGQTYNVRAEYIRERLLIPPASHDYQESHLESLAVADKDEIGTPVEQASSSTDQGWYPGHGKADSEGSDPLAWSAERYERETRTIDQLVDTLHGAHIGERSQDPAPEGTPSAWSEWAWHADRNQEGKYRINHGEYEYQWRDPDPQPDDIPTAWSEWTWHADRNQEGRYRINHGEYEYQWRNPLSSGSNAGKHREKHKNGR